jgi:hypothetical protein
MLTLINTRGMPLYVFEIRHLDSKTISAYEKSAEKTYSKAKHDGTTPQKLLRLFALYENLTRFVQPLCSNMTDRDNAQTPITLSTNIVDVSGVSLRQFWNLKSHMQSASTLATAHYPETLDRIFIIGAPIFFSTVWGWIKRWFDPITVSKIFILSSHEVKPTLEKFIDPKNIPKQYGGELEFKWGQLPNMDPDIVAKMTWEDGFKDFPTGPLYWRPIDGERLEGISVGSVDQKERMVKVCTMAKTITYELAKLSTDEEPPVTAAPEVSAEKPTEPSVPAEPQPEVITEPSTIEAPATSNTADDELTITDVQNLSIADAGKPGETIEVSEKLISETKPEEQPSAVA